MSGSQDTSSLFPSPPYDYAQRLSDLCSAWDSQARPIAAEILGHIAGERERGDRYEAENVRLREALLHEKARRIAGEAERDRFRGMTYLKNPGPWAGCAAPGNCPEAGCPLCDPQGAIREDA